MYGKNQDKIWKLQHMKVLFIGGTGNISTSCSKLAIEKKIDLYLLNRGKTEVEISGTTVIKSDIHNVEETKKVLANYTFDVVVNWIAYVLQDVKNDYEIFKDKTKQYIFISSASAYQKPLRHHIITESTPVINPFWEYSRNKIACEEWLLEKYRSNQFPVTIVRPSHTYATILPALIGSGRNYTIIDRMKQGKEIIVHGDGNTLWVLTHSDDFAKGFVGLLGNYHAVGHTFHITSDEVLTWNQIYEIMAEAIGVEPKIVHIPSDFINKYDKNVGASLLGDKAYSVIFDNTKIKNFVPDYRVTIPFKEGIKKMLAWFEEKEERKKVSKEEDELIEKIIGEYNK